jgi:hypothetical protein
MAFIGQRPLLVPTMAEVAFVWFHRIVAGYCLVIGIVYWIRLVGLYEGPLWRIDLMPVHWQIATVVLSVLFPFAGIGLWMMASWGPVIWFLSAAAEAVMYGVFPDHFGPRPIVLAAHGCVALLYLAFRAVLFFEKRRARARAAEPVY